MRNVNVGEVSDAVVKVDFYYEEGDAGEYAPVLRNVVVQKVESRKSRFPIWIRAYRRSPAERIVFEDCRFGNAAEPNVLDNVRDVTLLDVVVTRSGNKKP